ncbi:hypothetical protein AB1Y20_012963 [Prymnesium parvum]|uniref:Aminotransferase class I/classII large domain-containing protein n=1 Tax=Prymnesium parvum TaxID=97485 RepID=A0AB34IM90_PRYPA
MLCRRSAPAGTLRTARGIFSLARLSRTARYPHPCSHAAFSAVPRRVGPHAPRGAPARGLASLRASHRATNAYEAVIERVLKTHLKPGVTNLAPGVAHWSVPPRLVDSASREWSGYGACQGEAELLEALREKLHVRNGIDMSEREVLVTCGANQAFVQTILCLCDEGDEVVLFAPFYVSHMVALQICGVRPVVVSSAVTGQPDLSALRAALDRPGSRVRAVVLCTPSNPSGMVCTAPLGRALLQECMNHGAWLVTDEAYEDFVFDDHEHTSLASFGEANRSRDIESTSSANAPAVATTDGVISLFTFSKSYGLAGWRVGYMVYPRRLHSIMLKLQDTMPTHTSRHSQAVAHLALQQLGPSWVSEQMSSLHQVRRALWPVISNFSAELQSKCSGLQLASQEACAPPGGAIYFLIPLPPEVQEERAIRWLAQVHKLLLLPGSAFGIPGQLRLSYGCLANTAAATTVAQRLSQAFATLLESSAQVR